MSIQEPNIKDNLLHEIGIETELVGSADVSFNNELIKAFNGELVRAKQLDNIAKEKTLKWKQENMKKVYWICIACLACVFIIILLDGFKNDHFNLPIKVMGYIISGFVIQGLGLYTIVLYNLFPKGKWSSFKT